MLAFLLGGAVCSERFSYVWH